MTEVGDAAGFGEGEGEGDAAAAREGNVFRIPVVRVPRDGGLRCRVGRRRHDSQFGFGLLWLDSEKEKGKGTRQRPGKGRRARESRRRMSELDGREEEKKRQLSLAKLGD
jgi:hypothetical protein